MLSSSELVTQSEMEIFEAVESWLLYHYTYDKDKFRDSAALLLQLVRFPRMTITELYKVNEFTETAVSKDLLEISCWRETNFARKIN